MLCTQTHGTRTRVMMDIDTSIFCTDNIFDDKIMNIFPQYNLVVCNDNLMVHMT
jgi:hypothetical protein